MVQLGFNDMDGIDYIAFILDDVYETVMRAEYAAFHESWDESDCYYSDSLFEGE